MKQSAKGYQMYSSSEQIQCVYHSLFQTGKCHQSLSESGARKQRLRGNYANASSANALNTPTENEMIFFPWFSPLNTFVNLQERTVRAVCTCVAQCVYFLIILRLWHSEGTAGRTQDVNIWASVLWVKEMFSLPSVPICRSLAGISPNSLKYLTGDLLCVVTVWCASKFCFLKGKCPFMLKWFSESRLGYE